MDIADIFETALETFDEADPLWVRAGLMAEAPPRPVKGYVTASLAWLARVRPAVRSLDQLLVAMLLYRQCLTTGSRTVKLSNGELAKLGISRQTKYRALAWLCEARAIAIEEAGNGQSSRVTLLWFP